MAIRTFIVGGKQAALPLPGDRDRRATIQVVGACASGEEAVREMRKRRAGRIDLVLVHFDLPCMDGSECVRKLRRSFPDMPILMFIHGERAKDIDLIFTALHAGANGYLPGNLPASEFSWAIVQAHKAAKQNRPVFLLFYESDGHLSRSARYWHKITGMLNVSAASLSYGKRWRRMMMRIRNNIYAAEPLVPPLVLPDHELVAA